MKNLERKIAAAGLALVISSSALDGCKAVGINNPLIVNAGETTEDIIPQQKRLDLESLLKLDPSELNKKIEVTVVVETKPRLTIKETTKLAEKLKEKGPVVITEEMAKLIKISEPVINTTKEVEKTITIEEMAEKFRMKNFQLGPRIQPEQPVEITPAYEIVPGPPSVVIFHGDRTKAEIAFTFDDSGAGLGTILNILNRNGIKGTFFLLAGELRNNPERWRQAVKDGHEICNHTVGHRMDLPRLSEEQMKAQILGWETVAKEVLGEEYLIRMKKDFPYFRAPGGGKSERLQKVLGELGYPITAYWSHEDVWSMRAKNNPNGITKAQYYINGASRGDIFLAHGGSAGSVAEIIKGVQAKGYKFKLLSEILK